MRRRVLRQLIGIGGALVGLLLVSLPFIGLAQGPLDTSFTYQGRLQKNGRYVDATSCDFHFSLFKVAGGGTQLGATLARTATLNQGYFNAILDFGDVFSETERYLQVAVQCPPDAGFTSLSGRVKLKITPYALFARDALSAGQVAWSNIISMPPGFADNIDEEGGVSNYICASGGILKWVGGAWSCGIDVGSLPNSVDHGGLLGLGQDDHTQYLLVSGNRPMDVSLNMNGNRITNVLTGTAASDVAIRGQVVKVNDPAAGDLAGTYPNPVVARLRGFPVSTSPVVDGDTLIWDGSQWDPGSVLAEGPAGGDLTGNFPNPLIAPDAVGANEIGSGAVNANKIADNAVGMSELSIPMGSAQVANVVLVDGPNYLVFSSAFTPDSSGSCLVIASASLRTTGSSVPGGAWLRTASQTTGNSFGSDRADFGNSATSPSVSISEVWSVTGGQSTRFGCYVFVNDGSVADDEFVSCQVSYVCQ